jgi:hypothetical protein
MSRSSSKSILRVIQIRRFLTAVVVCCLVPVAPRAAQRAEDWNEVSGPGIVVAGNAGAERARDALRDLQQLHAALTQVVGEAGASAESSPVTVLAVSDTRALRELLPQYWERRARRPIGAYWNGVYGHHIALRLNLPRLLWGDAQSEVIVHEYIHYLTHLAIPEPPRWLDEGMSELLSSARIDEGVMDVGGARSRNTRLLRNEGAWIPLSELLAMADLPDLRDGRRTSMFYAESWALVHYLAMEDRQAGSHIDIASLPAKAGRYDAGELETRLKAYVRAGRFRTIRVAVPNETAARAEASAAPRVVPQTESLVLRARAIADGQRPAAALPLLTEALRLAPGNPAALETLGYVQFQQNQPDAAAGLFERAIASGSATFVAYYYRALLAGPVPNDVAGRPVPAREYLQKAVTLNPGFAPARERLAAP